MQYINFSAVNRLQPDFSSPSFSIKYALYFLYFTGQRISMNFNETCAQEALVREAKEFVQKNNLSKSQESCGAAMHRRCWDLFAVAGYCGMPLPETDGGGGIGLMDSMLVFETLAVAGVDIGLLFSLGVHQFAAAVPLALAGTDAQKSKWLATMARGEAIGALAVSEADAGADSYAMQARAVEHGRRFYDYRRKTLDQQCTDSRSYSRVCAHR